MLLSFPVLHEHAVSSDLGCNLGLQTPPWGPRTRQMCSRPSLHCQCATTQCQCSVMPCYVYHTSHEQVCSCTLWTDREHVDWALRPQQSPAFGPPEQSCHGKLRKIESSLTETFCDLSRKLPRHGNSDQLMSLKERVISRFPFLWFVQELCRHCNHFWGSILYDFLIFWSLKPGAKKKARKEESGPPKRLIRVLQDPTKFPLSRTNHPRTAGDTHTHTHPVNSHPLALFSKL